MLKLQGITKEYPLTNDEKVLALKGIDLEFRRCEFVSVLGQSGCGKTTLLNIIGGLDHYTDGDLFINGVSTKQYKDHDWDTYRNHSIGFIFQTYNLIMHLSVIENVELALTLSGVDKKERRERAKEALKSVGLEGQEFKNPNQLSGGQMQRVAIARALINDPEILLADEPTGALDSETSVQIMEILKEIAGERLIIMVTHNPDLAYQYSTRIVKLMDGKVIDDSKPYDSETEPEGELKPEPVEDEEQEEQAEAPAQEGESEQAPKKRRNPFHKSGKGGKTSMNYLSALNLSGKNLWTKRARTLLTSVAGSIGIIGIAIVLALSSGFGSYVQNTAANALSRYPLTITGSDMNVSSVASIFLNATLNGNNGLEEYPTDGEIGYTSVLGSMLQHLDVIFAKNDLPTLKVYLEEKFDPKWGSVKYNYDLDLHLYTNYASDDSTGNTYYKVNPYAARVVEQLNNVLGSSDSLKKMLSGTASFDQVVANLDSYSSMFAIWDELTQDQELLESQYELVAGEWPKDKTDLVFVVDKYNHIDDYMAFALGLANPNDAGKVVMSGIGTLLGDDEPDEENPLSKNVAAQTILDNLHYQLMLESDYYSYDAPNNAWVSVPYAHLADDKTPEVRNLVDPYLEDGVTPNPNYIATQLNVTGIVRLKKGVGSGAINGLIAYPHELIEWMIEAAKSRELVESQLSIKTTYQGQGAKNKTDYVEYAIAGSDIASPYSGAKVIAYERYYYDGEYHTEPRLEHGAYWNEDTYQRLVQNGTGITATRTYYQGSTTGYYRTPAPGDYAYRNVLTGEALKDSIDYGKTLTSFGYADLDSPSSISIYSSDFDNKDKIVKLLDDFASYQVVDEEGAVIREGSDLQYSDMVGTMLSAITLIIQAITYVLIAFSSISLVVSSIMIGIITYTSVIERTKEIGVLRSIGARKKDITRVFNSETFIVGTISGLLAVFVTWILTFPANAILKHYTDISGLVSIAWWHPLLLIGLSIFLTAVAGFIPSRIAARKDPVTALRTE